MIIPVQSASDTGSGQTLAQQLGGIPTFDPLGDQATFVEAGSGDAGWTVTAFGSAVPEPASLALTTLGGALPLAATRRRSRQ